MNSRYFLFAVLTVLSLRPRAQNIFTFAGNGFPGFTGDGGNAPYAEMNSARGVALDQAGNLLVADYYNNRVRKITPLGIMSTIAGNGSATHSGDGGPALSASVYGPVDLTVDKAGNIYVVEYYSHCIRKINTSGIISTFAGNVVGGYGGDGGPASSSQLYYPSGIAIDTAGIFYISDGGNQRIRKIDKTGTISTVAGNGTAGYAGDGGPAINSLISTPRGIAVDRKGNVYFAENTNHCIRVISASGMINTFAGTAMTSGYTGDGALAVNATFDLPYGVATDSLGSVYIADYGNDCLRKVDTSGIITTVAGNGNQGFSGDRGPAISARLNGPIDVTVAGNKTIYIADFNNFRVRAICSGACFLGVENLSAEHRISLFPNPGNGNFNVTLSDDEALELYVTDAVGREVRRQSLSKGNNPVTLRSAAKGIYFYRLMNADRCEGAGKIVVE